MDTILSSKRIMYIRVKNQNDDGSPPCAIHFPRGGNMDINGQCAPLYSYRTIKSSLTV